MYCGRAYNGERGFVPLVYPAGMNFNQQSDRMASGLEDQPQVFRVKKAPSAGPLLTWECDREGTPKREECQHLLFQPVVGYGRASPLPTKSG